MSQVERVALYLGGLPRPNLHASAVLEVQIDPLKIALPRAKSTRRGAKSSINRLPGASSVREPGCQPALREGQYEP